MRRTLSWLALCACAAPAPVPPAPATAATGAAVVASPSAPNALAAASTAPGTQQLARQILARPDLAAYHGWITYLQFRATHAAERHADAAAVALEQQQLAQWSRRILDNPQLLSELRGVTEWAYLSP